MHIAIEGMDGVGKTTYITKLRTGKFIQKYVATMGVEVHPLDLTDVGKYNVWDCAGQEKYGGLKEEYWIGATGAIVMFDLTRRISYNSVMQWCQRVEKQCPGIQIVVCGNKDDLVKDRKVKQSELRNIVKKYTYFDISAKSNYNCDKPFQLFQRM